MTEKKSLTLEVGMITLACRKFKNALFYGGVSNLWIGCGQLILGGLEGRGGTGKKERGLALWWMPVGL